MIVEVTLVMRSLIALLCVLPAALAAGGIEASVSSAGINYVIAQVRGGWQGAEGRGLG